MNSNDLTLISTQEQQSAVDQARAAAHEERAQKIAKNKAANENKPPKHSVKLAQARAKLPTLNETANSLLETVTQSDAVLSDIEKLAAHLSHHIREQKTALSRALSEQTEPPFAVGDEVTIDCASQARDQQFIGRTGVVNTVQNIHVLVDVDGKTLYLYLSDISKIAVPAQIEQEEAV